MLNRRNLLKLIGIGIPALGTVVADKALAKMPEKRVIINPALSLSDTSGNLLSVVTDKGEWIKVTDDIEVKYIDLNPREPGDISIMMPDYGKKTVLHKGPYGGKN